MGNSRASQMSRRSLLKMRCRFEKWRWEWTLGSIGWRTGAADESALDFLGLNEHVLEHAVMVAVHAESRVDGLGADVFVVHVEA